MTGKLTKFLFVSAVLFAVILVGNLESVHAQRGRDRNNNRYNQSGTIEWRGTVDDRVQLIISGRSLRVRTVSGTRYGNGSSTFSSPLPNRRDFNVNVKKRDGRGNVYIVQQPNRRNNYTAIIQIEDLKGKADNYRVEVTW